MVTDSAKISSPAYYVLLDGLRGIAAMMVIFYHVFEGFATSSVDQIINHGYLAVDFFFMLSGFVVGHAYDGRWSAGRISTGDFFRRRLIRLHPMLVFGVVLGFVTFAVQGFVKWDGTPVDLHLTLLAMLCSLFFIPAYPGSSCEVRGNGEMFPLNGPAWSLFFEYIGNIVYALVLRRLSIWGLAVVTVSAAVGLGVFGLTNGSGSYHLGVGWSLGDYNFIGGLLRLGFSFSAGLLMARLYHPQFIRGAFWICSLAIVGLLSVPFVGDVYAGTAWLNGLYDVVCVVLIFPVILYVGASGDTGRSRQMTVCGWLGRLSYPVYIVHYPFMYLFYAWVWGNGLSFAQSWPVALSVVAGSVGIAVLALKYYDEPVRRYLSAMAAAKARHK